MAVDTAKVRELREKTGLPMMECKRALEQTDGDVEKAVEALRKAGAKAQAKLSGRKATEGCVALASSGDRRGMAAVALRCETEPVSKNELFRKLVAEIAGVVLETKPGDSETLLGAALPSGETVREAVVDLVNQLRENISVGAFARIEGDVVANYVHFDQKKAALVALGGDPSGAGDIESLGKDLCMHVVFHRPQSLSRDKLDPQVIAKEREIRLAAAKNDPKNAKKPENILEKIVEGQINKFIEEQCFLEQAFIRDESVTVEEHVKSSGGGGLAITDYAYVATDV